jgi:hypothetical protein
MSLPGSTAITRTSIGTVCSAPGGEDARKVVVAAVDQLDAGHARVDAR